MKRGNTQQFVLLGIIGVVALVAIYIMIKALGVTVGPFQDNLQGQAGTTGIDAIAGQPLIQIGEGQTATAAPIDITLISADGENATIETAAGEHELALGKTRIIEGYAVTLYRAESGSVSLIVVDAEEACGQREQETRLCRGASACLDGTCTERPSCETIPADAAVTFGGREFYCCDGRVSGAPCSDSTPGSPGQGGSQ